MLDVLGSGGSAAVGPAVPGQEENLPGENVDEEEPEKELRPGNLELKVRDKDRVP